MTPVRTGPSHLDPGRESDLDTGNVGDGVEGPGLARKAEEFARPWFRHVGFLSPYWRRRSQSPSDAMKIENISMSVAMALISGFTPRRSMP